MQYFQEKDEETRRGNSEGSQGPSAQGKNSSGTKQCWELRSHEFNNHRHFLERKAFRDRTFIDIEYFKSHYHFVNIYFHVSVIILESSIDRKISNPDATWQYKYKGCQPSVILLRDGKGAGMQADY